MRKLNATLILSFILILVASQSLPVQAQQAVNTPVPQPTATDPFSQPGLVPQIDTNLISFNQLFGGEVQLVGPYDSASLVFGLPADWKLSGDGFLDLKLNASFNQTIISNQTGNSNLSSFGGILSVQFNKVTIASFPVNQQGESLLSVPIPASSLVSKRSDGRLELGFTFDSGISCDINQQMTVYIHSSSSVILPHEPQTPDTSLSLFPYPIYQATVFPDSALVIVPDDASASEIQAALAISASMANITSNNLALELLTVSQLSPEQRAQANLILIGKASSLAMLTELQMPLAPSPEEFVLNDADDGVVEMVISAWNPYKVALIISGNTDAGVEKAAQAVSTGVLRANAAPNLSIVENVQSVSVPVTIPLTQTLADLGYDSRTFSRQSSSLSRAFSTFSYKFYIPTGQVPTKDAYFEIAFGHSSLINYDRSGAVVLLNSQPIGSIRFSEEYAANAFNQVKISIPATAVLNGYNRMDIQVSIYPRDYCTTLSLRGLWFTIWPDSNFYLPLTTALINPTEAIDLSVFPAPFIFDASLDSTAIVVQRDNVDTWKEAFRMAAYIGDRANGVISNIKAYFGDDVPETARGSHNMIIIGQPSSMPFLAEINEKLPAPFSNDIPSESNMQVVYRISSDSPQGYLQLLSSPWNSSNILIVAAGNTAEGVNWAASALYDPILRGKLAGNYAAVTGSQIVTTDTRVSSLASGTTDGTGVVSQTSNNLPENLDLTPPPVQRPAWILQGILFIIGLILFIVLAVFATSWLQRRRKS